MYHQIPKFRLFLILSFLILILIGTTIFLIYRKKTTPEIQITNNTDNNYQSEERTDKNSIYIDISGQVISPGVYEMKGGERVKDLIEKAGGFTPEADQGYIERKLNQADFLTDGQKIYIPKIEENFYKNSDQTSSLTSEKISINHASFSELDSLPGIGEIRANSIIKNRPYGSIEELVMRKIIPQSVFDDIKNEISL